MDIKESTQADKFCYCFEADKHFDCCWVLASTGMKAYL